MNSLRLVVNGSKSKNERDAIAKVEAAVAAAREGLKHAVKARADRRLEKVRYPRRRDYVHAQREHNEVHEQATARRCESIAREECAKRGVRFLPLQVLRPLFVAAGISP